MALCLVSGELKPRDATRDQLHLGKEGHFQNAILGKDEETAKMKAVFKHKLLLYRDTNTEIKNICKNDE